MMLWPVRLSSCMLTHECWNATQTLMCWKTGRACACDPNSRASYSCSEAGVGPTVRSRPRAAAWRRRTLARARESKGRAGDHSRRATNGSGPMTGRPALG